MLRKESIFRRNILNLESINIAEAGKREGGKEGAGGEGEGRERRGGRASFSRITKHRKYPEVLTNLVSRDRLHLS